MNLFLININCINLCYLLINSLISPTSLFFFFFYMNAMNFSHCWVLIKSVWFYLVTIEGVLCCWIETEKTMKFTWSVVGLLYFFLLARLSGKTSYAISQSPLKLVGENKNVHALGKKKFGYTCFSLDSDNMVHREGTGVEIVFYSYHILHLLCNFFRW